ncbi:uncharacterized protein [Amphiura filiformis]|uniref:uncharacterized protein n=1 Tax=Amphiura filiformis TaxID=82378 RepID=UPI003B21507A
MKTSKKPGKQTRRGGADVVRILKCKYCRRNFYGNVTGFTRHIRNHERRYSKHWGKIKQMESPESNSKTTRTNEKSDVEHEQKQRATERFYVYIVYAPRPSCTCNKENQVNTMPCNCGFTFKRVVYASLAQMHRNLQNGVSYECQGCNSTVSTQETSNDYQGIGMSKCNRCNDTFVTVENLKAHQQVCLKFIKLGQVFKCLQCNTQLKSHEEMVEHTSNIHTIKDGTPLNISINICPVCGNNYATTKLLKAHLQTHPSYTKMGLVCCVCGLKEKDAFKLATHARLHMNGNKNGSNVKGKPEEPSKVLSEVNQSGSGTRTGSGSVSGSKSGSVSGSKSGSVCGSKSGSVSGSKSGSVSGSKSGSVSGSISGSVSGSKSESVSGSRSGSVSGSRFVSGSVSESRSGSVSQSVSGAKSGSESASISGSGFLLGSRTVSSGSEQKVKWSHVIQQRKTTVGISESAQPKHVAEIENKTSKVVEKSSSAQLNKGMRLRPRKQCKPTMYIDDVESEHESESNLFPNLPHACDYCERAFTAVGYLQTHKRTVHFGKNPFVCLICKRRFSDNTLFNLHREMHKEKFQCSFCQKSFDRLELLHNHDHIHGKSQFSPYKCLDCAKVYPDAKSLYTHMQIHRKEGIPKIPFKQAKMSMDKNKSIRYPCSSCERTFPSQFALRIHEKSVHKSDKVFQCKFCEKQFKFEVIIRSMKACMKTTMGYHPKLINLNADIAERDYNISQIGNYMKHFTKQQGKSFLVINAIRCSKTNRR